MAGTNLEQRNRTVLEQVKSPAAAGSSCSRDGLTPARCVGSWSVFRERTEPYHKNKKHIARSHGAK